MKGIKRGFTAGAFDLLHPGHLQFLHDASVHCDELVVGLHVDPNIEHPKKEEPVQTVYERYCQLMACRHVDWVIPYETERDLVNILASEGIGIRFLGSDYGQLNRWNPSEKKEITGEDVVVIKYIQRRHDYSSTELRERLKK